MFCELQRCAKSLKDFEICPFESPNMAGEHASKMTVQILLRCFVALHKLNIALLHCTASGTILYIMLDISVILR